MQEFLFAHEGEDETTLILKHKTICGLPASLIANQLKCRRKAKHKLPSWYNASGIVYPPSLNLEQSSSETTARFKQSLLKSLAVKSLADLTGGFGVDSFFFAGQSAVSFVEPNEGLLEIAKHNHQLLGVSIDHHPATAEKFITDSTRTFDLIYLDPSRRSKTQQKVFRLADCQPDLINLQVSLFERSLLILIKASPLLDIQQGLRELKSVKEVFVVSVDNECKELLFLCEKYFTGEPAIHCVNLRSNFTSETTSRFDDDFSFLGQEEKLAGVSFSSPLRFLFEPNSSILKGGAFKTVGNRFGLCKLQRNTHVYTHHQVVEKFPGRIFEVIESVKADKKLMEKFPNGHANIIVRNYPLTVEQIKKKTGLKEGGESYLIGCSDDQQRLLILARRLK